MKKVLVVDDEPPIRELLYEALTGKGYQVSRASSGEEAIVLLKKQRPDLTALYNRGRQKLVGNYEWPYSIIENKI